MIKLPHTDESRETDHPVENILVERWSPRAMNGEAIAQEDLLRLFEAARWAPSTYNEQEWRFLYAHRDGEHFNTFMEILVEANRTWCQHAGVLLCVLSHRVFERNGKPNLVHSLDTGMAVQNLLLQASSMKLVAHAMVGFDHDAARTKLEVPEDYGVECMIAVGHYGDPNGLPDELREREKPSGRKPVSEFIREGGFAF